MAVIRPFKALRPRPEVAYKVASVPYDVVNRAEAYELAKDNPINFLRITRSEIELPENFDPYLKDVYEKAKENLDIISQKAPLFSDEKPHFYLYQLEMDGRKQVGIAATFSVDDYVNNVILKHEKTRKVKEDDRTNHIVTTSTQTGAVFLTYKGVDKINKMIEDVLEKCTPLYGFKTEDNIEHRLWVVPDELNVAIIEEFTKVKNLYIADGHHRAASAFRAREVMKEKNPNHTGDEEYNYFMAVLFPAEQLKILPYNRVVTDFNGLDKDQFFQKIKETFDVEETSEKEPKKVRTHCMYLDGQWYNICLKKEYFDGDSLKDAKTVGETLDVSILQNYLLEPVLGIDDPRTNHRVDFVGGIRGTQELEKLVDSGKYAVAFSMYPVSVSDLMNISDAGEVMPPKSTWFEPKLRDGLLTHII